MPPDPVPDHIAVREALRRLEDPVRRVVDEFFWFWPLPETDGTELAQARKAWERLANSRAGVAEDADAPDARSIAVHNLAVLHHAEALEAKEFYGVRGRRTLWERAYRYWRQVLDDDGCWRRLDERIRVLDDPRLRAVDGTALREALPAVLLDLHARLAVDEARRKKGEDAALQHVSLMWGFAVDAGLADAGVVKDGVVDAALRRVTAPFAAAIRHRTEAIPGPGADPSTLDRAADSLLTETRADVRVLRTVLGAEHPVSSDAADEVATAVNACAVACANSLSANKSTARDPRVSRAAAHLRSARVLAASGHVRSLVEQNLAVLLSNDILLDCKEAVERADRSPGRRAVEQASGLLDTVEPRLRELRELRPHAPETDQVRDAVAMAACRLYTEYVNTTRDIDKALPGYRRVLPLAAGEEARSVIRQNIDTLTRAAAGPAVVGTPGQCFRCGRSVGASEVLAVTGGGFTDSGSVGIPCCAGCRYEAMDLLDRAGLAPDPDLRYEAGYRPLTSHHRTVSGRGASARSGAGRRRGGGPFALLLTLIALTEGVLIGAALLVGPETTAGKWLSGSAFLIGTFVVTELVNQWENRKK
ncbi:hypothetical protein ACGFWF_31860 [Streptomyces sp. NPDC048581]|uniref:hypothetical protein n=1 Tax=Streptomyces sp. NPDC048581 TaxID=3365572 RepID=UPI0037113DC1